MKAFVILAALFLSISAHADYIYLACMSAKQETLAVVADMKTKQVLQLIAGGNQYKYTGKYTEEKDSIAVQISAGRSGQASISLKSMTRPQGMLNFSGKYRGQFFVFGKEADALNGEKDIKCTVMYFTKSQLKL